ncbi:MAG TPA: gamma-glutamyltransferase [Verrucomicrobiae bacterium]|nr:gamma-glutamyltransferase [Verrucomicrobiae bacterium]
MIFQRLLIRALILLLPLLAHAAEHAGVATVHPLATAAALKVLHHGGNAVDATVAAALTLGVVDGHNSGLGGGCFLLLRLADAKVIAIDGREIAPASATKEMFLRKGQADPNLSQTGALSVGIPGSVAAYEYAIKHFGKLSWTETVLPAAELAARGFKLDRSYAGRLAGVANDMKQFASTRAVFLNPVGQPWKAGETLKQPALAASYRALAEQGSDWFYKGAFAAAAGEWMKENGGLITSEDFRNYKLKLRDPLHTTYRGYEIIGFPPPSSGGVHVAQILNILERFDLKAMGRNSPDFVHVVTEAMKLAFADRAFWLGDPDFASVPRGLVSRTYGARLAKPIRMDRASKIANHGTPENAASDIFSKHTTHFSVADSEGNWAACTATINTTFGSKVVVPGTGVVLNNQMDDFSAQPGVANYFGLIGAEANAAAPGKRPLSSMSPTLVLKDGKPILSLGAAGGPTIISQTLLAIIGSIDFGLDPNAALTASRFHHQWLPDELLIEKSMPRATLDELRRRGHVLKIVDAIGACQMIGIDERSKTFDAAHDPRVSGQAGGF